MVGAAAARRLHKRGPRVAIIGLEPERLERVAADWGGAPRAAGDPPPP